MRRAVFPKALAFTGVFIGLSACGGGGGGTDVAGIGGTGIIATGEITGFGSVIVNNIKFETTQSRFDVDGTPMDDQSALDLGMVVTIKGTVNADGKTGTATTIVYNDEVEGPVADAPAPGSGGATKTFVVLGTTVVVDQAKTRFRTDSHPDFGFATITRNDVVEVSGFFDPEGRLRATYIEKKGVWNQADPGTVVEVKGAVTVLGETSFKIGALTIQYDASDLKPEDFPGGLQAGAPVEVKGYLLDGATIDAIEIEAEDEGFAADEGDASVEGIVSEFNGVGDFKVNRQRVDASGAVFEPSALKQALANGVRIEVEGPIAGGILKARKVESEDD